MFQTRIFTTSDLSFTFDHLMVLMYSTLLYSAQKHMAFHIMLTSLISCHSEGLSSMEALQFSNIWPARWNFGLHCSFTMSKANI